MLSPYYFVGVKDSGIYSEIVLLLLFSLISIAVQMFYILRLKIERILLRNLEILKCSTRRNNEERNNKN